MKKEGSLLLSEYEAQIAPTDLISQAELAPIQQGLYGEVGGIMATAKKITREGPAYPEYRTAAEEEFGDALWYLSALCRRMHIPLEEVFAEATNHGSFKNVGAASDIAGGALAYIALPIVATESVDLTLVRLGQAAAALLIGSPARADVISFARAYLDGLQATRLVFSTVARNNLRKARGAFVEPTSSDLDGLDFDTEFEFDEQLPRNFKIEVGQRAGEKTYLKWKGVFIGDPLTDNISDRDGYRFHDVFHLAYASVLHWSPVFRALIKHKRKSNPKYDEEQDSGRAIVVEEGLSAWIFSKAKELQYFEGHDRVSLGMLKTIAEFVKGYEVEDCPLKLWERAILQGYAVFRQLKANQGGIIIGDRDQRTIKYELLKSV
ncbi:nucleoside triphosphate pyrophosphohydrolase family protein [Cupriavidus basilensis]|uniref:Nucleoside triphosphate pyrophosphohydrolase family protein n=1 Tax=Cupriavidus basilensis TaxID=68895 RepID=A0A643FM52_9BURK|nr:nucleoside triphosphate pyrophosphohydrolase family protein [Cupriavidus basilensis]QOT82074.1 nucleoside triphosphate pyrophosphohydrolase family protein [Cupriavidus basilensis]